jgi:TRAP-type C4-dicarboxylate transport system permease large subunit
VVLDPGISIILIAPVVMPMATQAGIHPVQLGIFIIINCVIGTITPPVGNVLFAVANIAKMNFLKLGVSLIPFLIGGMLVLLLIGMWGDLTLYLPRQAGLIN